MPITGGLALSQPSTERDAAKENLNSLTGKAAKSKTSVDASDEVIREREFKLPRFLPGTESAEFFVLLASDGKSKAFSEVHKRIGQNETSRKTTEDHRLRCSRAG